MEKAKVFDKIEQILKGEAHLDQIASKKQDPFKILISTILSARTRDRNTKEATETLFSKYSTPQEIANANIEELEQLIYKSGFYKVKAARIKEVAKLLLEKYEGKVPNTFKDLLSLPGVGTKTANCVLVYAFKIPAIPVDTHVHRISNRIGWVKTKNPNDTEKELRALIPTNQWIRVNRLFVRFGQEICLPNGPKCDICPLTNRCPRDFSMEQAIKKKKNKI
ncbi:MAG: endonuclease III domain-containing protein [Candidatus Odinarchaeota archaeon]